MKNHVKPFYPILLVIVSICFIQCENKGKDSEVHQFLQVQADFMNMKCPINVNTGLRIDSVTVEPHKKFSVYYTLFDLEAKDVEITDLENVARLYLQKSEDLIHAKALNVEFTNFFKNERGNNLAEIILKSELYNASERNLTESEAAKSEVRLILRSMTNGVSKQLPTELDAGIEIIACRLFGDTLTEFTYQLKYQNAANCDMEELKQLKYAELKHLANMSAEGQMLLKNGASFKYTYVDANKDYLFHICLDESDLSAN